MIEIVGAGVSESPLDPAEASAAVGDDRAGAVVSFTGVVRNHDGGRAVDRIEYSCHPKAGEVIESIAAKCAEAFEGRGVHRLWVGHRVGELAVGDVAFLVAVSASHRAEAFEACSWLVEEVKRDIPVWKRQVFPDGSHEWSNSA
ncbi:molybdenum cofactor biosynthesis protein MoaE [Corynebacterium freneyi]|uniref:Molybdopterin synthase catalytic subunit n=1 Tax=Corynebacterium freneyi TaxID=134034 RepID=A0ABS4U9G8_9CORY|nr:molybdenum cofactor biosynthesis protein MoaE [Corynebacterium freneyi]MBP2333177.1 molybdopterin synthase catalytic subunit [Corynebacterium freneyi]